MDGPRDCPTEWSQREKDKYHMTALTHEILKKKNGTTYLQNRNRITDVENKLMITKGQKAERDKFRDWELIYTHYYL